MVDFPASHISFEGCILKKRTSTCHKKVEYELFPKWVNQRALWNTWGFFDNFSGANSIFRSGEKDLDISPWNVPNIPLNGCNKYKLRWILEMLFSRQGINFSRSMKKLVWSFTHFMFFPYLLDRLFRSPHLQRFFWVQRFDRQKTWQPPCCANSLAPIPPLLSWSLQSLKLTAKAPENGWLEYDHFLLGPGLFSGANC